MFVGDLNTVPAGATGGDLPHPGRQLKIYKGCRALPILEDAGLRTVAHEDDTPFWTHPVGTPNRTLDYILFSRHFRVDDYRVLHSFTLSDHYPVEATLTLKSARP